MNIRLHDGPLAELKCDSVFVPLVGGAQLGDGRRVPEPVLPDLRTERQPAATPALPQYIVSIRHFLKF